MRLETIVLIVSLVITTAAFSLGFLAGVVWIE